MPSNPTSPDSSFVPEEPLSPESGAFFDKVTGMRDSQPKDAAVAEAAPTRWDGILEKIAGELYRISSMLLGEGEEAIGLIEDVIAHFDLQACSSQAEARHLSRLLLAADAISALRERDTANHTVFLAAPVDGSGPSGCIEDDDLEAAGVTLDELEQMISGPDAYRLRTWLEGLSLPLRVIFVLRAIAGLSSVEVATLLAEHGGEVAQNWTPDTVRSGFRQALCSLASQLIHATASK